MRTLLYLYYPELHQVCGTLNELQQTSLDEYKFKIEKRKPNLKSK